MTPDELFERHKLLAQKFRRERGKLTIYQLARKHQISATTAARVVAEFELTVTSPEERRREREIARQDAMAELEETPETLGDLITNPAVAAAAIALRREVLAAKAHPPKRVFKIKPHEWYGGQK